MTVDRTITTLPAFETTLATAAAAYRGETSPRPPASAVVSALLQAEKAAKQQKLNYPIASVLGRWRLCFVVTTKKPRHRKGIALGRGLYVPKFVKPYISFSAQPETLAASPGKAEIANQLQIGPLLLQLTGPAQYLGKKNLLAFDFTQMQLCLFGSAIYRGKFPSSQAQAEDFYRQSIAKLPFFAFFIMSDNFIAARGRGGGLALWIKES